MNNLVVVPTYLEADNIVALIEAITRLDDCDVLVVDDDSPDGTADLVDTYSKTSTNVHLLRRVGPRGLGPAYVDGFKFALRNGYERVITMDADFSHDPGCIPNILSELERHDVVVASRYCGGRVSVINWPLSRLILSIFAGKYVRVVTGLKISDPTSGFRAFKAQVLAAIGLDTIRSNGYSFQVETLSRACRCGFRIGEIPIIFTERRGGQSKMTKRIVLEAAIMPWRLRFSTFKRNDQHGEA